MLFSQLFVIFLFIVFVILFIFFFLIFHELVYNIIFNFFQKIYIFDIFSIISSVVILFSLYSYGILYLYRQKNCYKDKKKLFSILLSFIVHIISFLFLFIFFKFFIFYFKIFCGNFKFQNKKILTSLIYGFIINAYRL